MMIKVVMFFFIALLLVTAFYLWHCRKSSFLIFNAQSDASLSRLLSFTSLALLVVSIIGLLILCSGNKYLNFITLILGVLVILIFGWLINQKE